MYGDIEVYSVERGVTLPDSILNSDTLTLALDHDGILHVTATAKVSSHAELAAAMSVPIKDYDRWIRVMKHPAVGDNLIVQTAYASAKRAGLLSLSDDPAAADAVAMRNIKRLSRSMRSSGFSDEQPLKWFTASGARGTSVILPLSEWKEYDITEFFKQLPIVEKGGPGSGHRGHVGRPGKRGGSSPGTGGAKEVEIVYGAAADAEGVEKATRLTEQDYRDMFHLSGYSAHVEHSLVTVRGKIVGIETKIVWKDEAGETVAKATRGFDGKHKRTMNFDFEVEASKQGQGLGRALYRQQIDVLTRAGYKEIALTADITIGRYAWAKVGFDYFDSATESSMKSTAFRYWARGRGIEEPAGGWPRFKSAYDVATYKISGVSVLGRNIRNSDVPSDMSMDVGKAFMLDKTEGGQGGHGSWDGVLKLGGT